MNKAEFQKKLVRLWMTTDGELTAPIVAKHTGVGASDLKAFLRELIAEGAITTSRSAENQLTFQVPKKPRAAQVKKLRALKAAREAAAAKAGTAPPRAAKPDDAAAKKAVAAERKRKAKAAAESLEDEPLTAAEMEKLMALTASVSADADVQREREEKLKAKEAELKADQAARLAAMDNPGAGEDEPEPKPKPKKAKKQKAKKPSSLDKAEMALELYEAMDDKPAVVEDKEDEGEKKPGFFARLRGKFRARDALELADQAKKEIEEPKEPGKKRLLVSWILSTAFGPVGWNYAGSFREAIPSSVVWLAFVALVGKLPIFSVLLLPALLAGMGISGLMGLVYAWQYNKHGKRKRLFGDSDKKKQLTD